MTAAVQAEPFLIREGSSLRTQDELDYIFVQDVEQISQWSHPDDYERASDYLCEAELAIEEVDDWSREDLQHIAASAEGLLNDMGFYVEWNDGYVIYRDPDGDGPFPNGAPWKVRP
ncbi:hypothetical protein KIP49_gp14 [Mycobacterium phage Scorpia]|uniref:Uncharacterized protein n=1 Tax=Mycobacterium phage Scorpia TaxID=2517968 RepID=A0A482J501_9CAUD|nr:hypothetical protein KIP49_gp14 [Mycobacterium phage Scorpia]QBP29077.1 hypothetical protein SEA_SCORPIA_78 [Mycobacterium phage Scorpia]